MGPSGAGKTTLLNILSGRLKSKKKISGSITINGSKATKKLYSSLSGFVAQDDILLGAATAYELLLFNAGLRFPSKSLSERKALVMALLRSLGLESVKDNFIGYTGGLSRNSGIKRGLSGGERKRVSICYELISNPKLLFLDEPTSGLDSFAAKAVVESLRSLAFTGRTIVTTIHQPSAEIFQMFDDLCLLADGGVVYFGPAHLAAPYFTKIGHPPPERMNYADFFLRVLHTSNEQSEDEIENASFANSNTGEIKEFINTYKTSDQKKKVSKDISKLAKLTPPEKDSQREKPSWWKQYGLLVKRSATVTFREPALFKMRIVLAIFISIFGGLVWLRQGLSQASATDRVSAAFFMLNAGFMTSLSGTTNVFPAERAFFFRERQSNLYSTLIYYLSKQSTEIPLLLIVPFISNTILYFMVGFNDDVESWIMFVVVLILINLAGSAIGYFITCAVLDVRIANSAVQPLFLLPTMLFSGFFLNSSNIPVYFIWLEYISILKYGFRGAINSIFGLNPIVFECDPGAVCRFPDGDAVRRYYDSYDHPIWLDCVILIAIAVCWHILAFVCLYLRGRKVKA